MTHLRSRGFLGCCLVLWFCTQLAGGAEETISAVKGSSDDRLAAARRLVDRSNKYLHHSHLRRGMKGYGLTVLAGTELVRFGVDIVSVMYKWGPHQDAILAKLSGHNLEKSGIIAGMSGSPCYVRHEGRDKLIGAVAFGWSAQKEPLCGIQPITQMLAIAGLGDRDKPAATQPASAPAVGMATGWHNVDEFVQAVLVPEKIDFCKLMAPRQNFTSGGTGAMLRPLPIPVMVGGAGGRSMALLAEALKPAGMIPLQAGVGISQEGSAKDAKLVPGGAMSVPMVTGDASYSAVGTVTDIIGDRVLAFGHGFYSYGEAKFPMGPAYVNTVVSHLFTSFKLASDLRITGTLDRDEMVGVAGRIGPVPSMIPMTVDLVWVDLPEKHEHHRQSYSYNIVRHRWMTPLMASLLTEDAVWQWRYPPRRHTIRHEVTVDFKDLGRYQASNVVSDRDVFSTVSDLVRPLVAMLNNPFGEPPEVQSIAVKVEIDKGTLAADLLDFKLDGKIYRPGQTITGKVTVRPFRKERFDMPVSFSLPEDIPVGSYELTACDYMVASASLGREMPHRYKPRTVKQLFGSLQRAVALRGDRLYLRLPLKAKHLAIEQQEFADLPESKQAMVRQAKKLDTDSFTVAVVRDFPCRYVLKGSAKAPLEIQETPGEIPVRGQEDCR